MARVRTINKGYDEYREKDPGTALTRTGFRRLVTSGQVPSVRVGQKYLIDMDIIEEYLRGTIPMPMAVVPGIREVKL